MNNPSDKQLEDLIHQQLKDQPDLNAPASLVPRVMRAITSPSSVLDCPRQWWTWRVELKIASAAASLLVLTLFVYAASQVWVEFPSLEEQSILTGLWRFGSLGVMLGETFANALLVVAKHVGLSWLAAAVSLILLMYAACVALGTLCVRLAVKSR